MKKVLVSLLMCCFLVLDVFAQAPAAAPAQADPAPAPAKKTVSRGKAKKTAEAATPAAPAEAATPATPATPAVQKDKKAPKTHTAPAPGTATTGTDKLIGKDAKGREIYQGPKGGQYYMSNGNKQYLAKDDKLKK